MEVDEDETLVEPMEVDEEGGDSLVDMFNNLDLEREGMSISSSDSDSMETDSGY